jgi:hypothetical protein
MKKLSLLLILLPALLSGQSITATYEIGDIPTSAMQYSESCNGPLTTLELELPAGSLWQVTGVNVQYTMTALGFGWKSHQRSMIYCENTATGESTAAQGIGNTTGTQSYKRNGLNIANGIYPGNTTLVFQMRAWRAESLNFGCNTFHNKVDNSTWTIAVYYEQVPDDGSAGIGTMAPDASAILELQSLQKGFLPPRMSTAFREAIPNPATGLMVYDTDLGSMQVFNGAEWSSIVVGSDMQWATSGNDIYYNEGNVGIGTSEPAALLHASGTGHGEGNLLFEGEYKSDNPGDPPAEGAGTRMMWYPDKAAFRVGRVVGTQWDKDNIGDFSVAMGRNTTASGSYSMAMGRGTTASTFYSTAMGYETTASGWSSTAIGHNTTASGLSSTAIGSRTTAPSFAETVVGLNNTDYTPNSTNLWISNDRLFVIGNGTSSTARSNAMTVLKNGNTGIGTDTPTALLHTHGPGQGEGNVVFTGVYKSSSVNQGDPPAEGAGTRMMWYPDKGAFRAGGVDGTEWNKNNIGNYSMALGYETTASGHYSTAMGRGTTASGWSSTAMGEGTTASGSSSTAMGLNTNAPSFAETAVGIHNTESFGASANSWQPNDRVFVIGVGSSSSDPRNAMTVLKNGNIALGTHTPHGNSLLSTWREGPGQAGVIFQGQVYENNPGDPPATHPGTRMMWYPDKAAFRAGEIWEDVWNKHTIGYHSVAFNFNTRASGNGSVAMGINTSAPSYGETAIGVYNTHYVPGSATERDDNDRLFVIGNGNLGAHSNALTLFKNGNMALGAHSAGNHRLRVISSAPGSGGATAYFENEHASGIALSASTNSDDGTMLLTQHGDGYIMRLDRYRPEPWNDWRVSMIVKGGRVGINTENPTQTLDVNGGLRIRLTTTVGGGIQELYKNADGVVTTSWGDKRLKNNIKTIDSSLKKILQLRGVSFKWINEPEVGGCIGMIAQEVEKILPELVFTDENNGYKGINYSKITAVLVEAIKEQQAIIEAQNQLNAEIYKELELLKSRMNALEALK